MLEFSPVYCPRCGKEFSDYAGRIAEGYLLTRARCRAKGCGRRVWLEFSSRGARITQVDRPPRRVNNQTVSV